MGTALPRTDLEATLAVIPSRNVKPGRSSEAAGRPEIWRATVVPEAVRATPVVEASATAPAHQAPVIALAEPDLVARAGSVEPIASAAAIFRAAVAETGMHLGEVPGGTADRVRVAAAIAAPQAWEEAEEALVAEEGEGLAVGVAAAGADSGQIAERELQEHDYETNIQEQQFLSTCLHFVRDDLDRARAAFSAAIRREAGFDEHGCCRCSVGQDL